MTERHIRRAIPDDQPILESLSCTALDSRAYADRLHRAFQYLFRTFVRGGGPRTPVCADTGVTRPAVTASIITILTAHLSMCTRSDYLTRG
jgi:hypothetical protein